MSLNYNIIDAFYLLGQAFKHKIFISIILSSIILFIVFLINKKIAKYIVLSINLLILFLVNYYYLSDIIKFDFENILNNIYFYFFNSIIFLLVSSLLVYKKKYRLVDYIFYSLFLINISFSLFMTYYLSNIDILVIGNIFPMIKFGNIIYIVYYLYRIIYIFIEVKRLKIK